jgi:hypothetical protein
MIESAFHREPETMGLGQDGTISDTETFQRIFDWIRARLTGAAVSGLSCDQG